MKKQKRVIIFDKNQYDGDWPPEDAAGCVAWFASKLEAIPLEHRDTAKIEIYSSLSYDVDHSGHIEIYYTRLETFEEMKIREVDELRYKENRKKELRKLLEGL